MPYQFVPKRQDYTDLSSGRVFYSQPGFPAFPVRLASEMFQRCLALRKKRGQSGPCRVYDPCSGGSYHLVALAYLHWDAIEHIQASDIDPAGVRLSEQNLSLLTLAGMDRRIAELSALRGRYGKESHAEALESASRLRARLCDNIGRQKISTGTFVADGLSQSVRIREQVHEIDILITDLPYGQHTSWKIPPGMNTSDTPIVHLLDQLLPLVTPTSILAFCADKGQKIVHPSYNRVAHFQVGKRQVVYLAAPAVTSL